MICRHGPPRKDCSFEEIALGLKEHLKDFFFGFAVLPHLRTVVKMRFEEDMFMMTLTIGDMIGLPIMPPVYKLSLLPYWLPLIRRWKKELLGEKGALEKIEE